MFLVPCSVFPARDTLLQRMMRYQRFLSRLEEEELDGFVVTRPANLEYLFHFRGSVGAALVLKGETALLVDSRYITEACSTARHCRPCLAPKSLDQSLQQKLKKACRKSASALRIGFESDFVSHDFVRRVESWDLPIRWTPASGWVAELRMIKQPEEIRSLKKAFRQAQAAFSQAMQEVEPGLSEVEIAGRLEWAMRRQGADAFAFETIVAAGPRSALPHARPELHKWKAGQVLLIDFGLRLKEGYCSDLTRVLLPSGGLPGKVSQIVREARQKALQAIRPGVQALQVDAAARDWIDKQGYGEYFGHGLGHGLGLEVHEPPSIRPRSELVLQEGMAFTVEPGIYLPDRFGIRIEDAVVVCKDGFEFLSDPEA